MSLPGPDHEFHNYQTAVAHAPQEGWTPYWLGRSFEAGGMTFEGPSVADFGDEINGGGIIMSYNASMPGRAGGIGFHITLYSASAWFNAEAHGSGRVPVGAQESYLGVAGGSGTVRSGPTDENGTSFTADLGDTHVVAVAGPALDSTGRELNPLLTRDTFIAVIQHLRPYPQ